MVRRLALLISLTALSTGLSIAAANSFPEEGDTPTADNSQPTSKSQPPATLYGSAASSSVNTVEHSIRADWGDGGPATRLHNSPFDRSLRNANRLRALRPMLDASASSNTSTSAAPKSPLRGRAAQFDLTPTLSLDQMNQDNRNFQLHAAQTFDQLRSMHPQTDTSSRPTSLELQDAERQFKLQADKTFQDFRAHTPGFEQRDRVFFDNLQPLKPKFDLPGTPPPERIATTNLPESTAEDISQKIQSQLKRASDPDEEEGAAAHSQSIKRNIRPQGDAETAEEKRAAADIEGQLLKGDQTPTQSVSQQIAGELLQAKRFEVGESAKAQALFARVHIPTTERIENLDNSAILWDEWHANFAKLAEDEILTTMPKHGNASGADTVQITVTRDHKLAVVLVRESNSEFDSAIIDAYRALDGNPALAFPIGSQRNQVTFQIDHNHETEAPVSSVESVTASDKEISK